MLKPASACSRTSAQHRASELRSIPSGVMTLPPRMKTSCPFTAKALAPFSDALGYTSTSRSPNRSAASWLSP